MSGALIEIRPEGLFALNRRIDRLLAGLKNPQPLLWELAKAGEVQTQRRITEEQHGPNGEIWPQWSPAYAHAITRPKRGRGKKRHGGVRKLEATGELIRSVTAFADRQTAGWGTNLKYAAIHQFGFDGSQSVRAHSRKGHQVSAHERQMNMPARPFFGVSDENYQEFLDITERWFDRLLGASA